MLVPYSYLDHAMLQNRFVPAANSQFQVEPISCSITLVFPKHYTHHFIENNYKANHLWAKKSHFHPKSNYFPNEINKFKQTPLFNFMNQTFDLRY